MSLTFTQKKKKTYEPKREEQIVKKHVWIVLKKIQC